MVLYKPDCNSNDCELPSGQATPSILAKGMACGEHELHMGQAFKIEYHIRLHWQQLCLAGCWQTDCWLQVLMKAHLDLNGQAVRTCENKNTCENAQVFELNEQNRRGYA